MHYPAEQMFTVKIPPWCDKSLRFSHWILLEAEYSPLRKAKKNRYALQNKLEGNRWRLQWINVTSMFQTSLKMPPAMIPFKGILNLRALAFLNSHAIISWDKQYLRHMRTKPFKPGVPEESRGLSLVQYYFIHSLMIWGDRWNYRNFGG